MWRVLGVSQKGGIRRALRLCMAECVNPYYDVLTFLVKQAILSLLPCDNEICEGKG